MFESETFALFVAEGKLLLKHCFTYISNTEIHDPYFAGMAKDSFFGLLFAMKELIKHSGRITCCVVVLLLKILLIAYPYVARSLRMLYELHLRNFTTTQIVVEILVILLLSIVVLYREKINSFIAALKEKISTTSKTLAIIFPYAICWVVGGAIVSVRHPVLVFVLSSKFQLVYLLAYPTVATVFLRKDFFCGFTNGKKANGSARQLLKLWVVTAAMISVLCIVRYVPLSNLLMPYLGVATEFFSLNVLILPLFDNAVNVLYENWAKRVIKGLLAELPLNAVVTSPLWNSFNFLSRFGVWGAEKSSMLTADTIKDIIVALICSITLLLPSSLSHLAVIVNVLLWPSYKTILMLEDPVENEETPDPDLKNKSNTWYPWLISLFRVSETCSGSRDSGLFYVDYWLCFSVLWSLYAFSQYRMWSIVMLVLANILQNSWLKGSSTIVEVALSLLCDPGSAPIRKEATAETAHEHED